MEPAIIIPILVLLLLALALYADAKRERRGFCRGLSEYDTQGEWL